MFSSQKLSFIFNKNLKLNHAVHKKSSTLDSFETNVVAHSLSGDFSQSFVAQKNFILLDKFLSEVNSNGNLTDVATQYVNFCDESFNIFLNERISNAEIEPEKQKTLGKIRYEINSARQKKLIEADNILRGIICFFLKKLKN
jgi:hypothetical protein